MSAYQRLDEFFACYPAQRVTFLFEALQAVVDEELPEAARASADWWLGGGTLDTPALYWVEWQVEAVYVQSRVVTFRRRGWPPPGRSKRWRGQHRQPRISATEATSTAPRSSAMPA